MISKSQDFRFDLGQCALLLVPCVPFGAFLLSCLGDEGFFLPLTYHQTNLQRMPLQDSNPAMDFSHNKWNILPKIRPLLSSTPDQLFYKR